jgi:hypothetical protein
MNFQPPDYDKILRVACVLALVALALMVWSLVDPRPFPVVMAMSIGQVIGILSLLLYVGVVFHDARHAYRVRESVSMPPPPPPGE